MPPPIASKRIAREAPGRLGLGGVLLHPGYISVDPALQKLSAGGTDTAISVEQTFFA